MSVNVLKARGPSAPTARTSIFKGSPPPTDMPSHRTPAYFRLSHLRFALHTSTAWISCICLMSTSIHGSLSVSASATCPATP